MIGEILAIGDELTSGQRLDTNSQWLSERLAECGIRVLFHTTVADDLAAMTEAFRVAAGRAGVVVSTGGLGPTADDLTRDALAVLAGVELIEDARSLRHIQALFRLRSREMPERNRIQALFPAGSAPIPNRHGTAPGIDITLEDRCRWFALPGVPAEMHDMWYETVESAVRGLLPEPRVILHRRVNCFGAGESRIEELLPDLIRRGREPTVGITASRGTITLRVTASGPDATACERAMQPTLQTIRHTLGELVFGEEDEELEDAVAGLLRRRQATLATLEVGTDGEIAHWMTRVGEGVFQGGLVGGDLASLMRLTESTPAEGATSTSELPEADWLAVETRRLSGSDVSLVVVAPTLRTATARDEVVIAMADANGINHKQFPLAAHPDIQQTLAAKRGLNELRLWLGRPSAGA